MKKILLVSLIALTVGLSSYGMEKIKFNRVSADNKTAKSGKKKAKKSSDTIGYVFDENSTDLIDSSKANWNSLPYELQEYVISLVTQGQHPLKTSQYLSALEGRPAEVHIM